MLLDGPTSTSSVSCTFYLIKYINQQTSFTYELTISSGSSLITQASLVRQAVDVIFPPGKSSRRPFFDNGFFHRIRALSVVPTAELPSESLYDDDCHRLS